MIQHITLQAKTTLNLETLDADTFSQFGSVIENPQHSLSARAVPTQANQGTAFKYANVSTLSSEYQVSPSQRPSKPAMSMFVCKPRRLRSPDTAQMTVGSVDFGFFELLVMERHPYSSQTFVPLGLSGLDETSYVVVVAPTLLASQEGGGMPDITQLRAFEAHGKQAVTYSAGTWHAPMIVVGKRSVDFVVFQFLNGIESEDCEEIRFTGEGSISIAIRPATLNSPH